MVEDVDFIPVEIPRTLYEQQVINLINALLAVDESLFPNESVGKELQVSGTAPQEAA